MTSLNQLKKMNDKEIQTWLKKVDEANVISLVIALLDAEPTVVECVTRNMSRTAAAQLKLKIDQYKTREIGEAAIRKNAAELEKLF